MRKRFSLPAAVLLRLSAALAILAAGPVAAGADIPTSSGRPADITIAAADDAKKAVEQRERQLIQVLNEITEHVDQLQPGQYDREKVVLDKFKTLVPRLREQASWLLAKEGEFNKQVMLLKGALEKAPKAYAAAATAYQRYAQEEEDDFLKEQYCDMAERARKFGEAMQARGRDVDRTYADVHAKLRFVAKSLIFLNRLEDFLKIYDPVAMPGEEVSAYLAKLNAYVSNFEQSLRAFKSFSDKITSPYEVRPDPSPKAAPPPAGGIGDRGAGTTTRTAAPAQPPPAAGGAAGRATVPAGAYRISRVDRDGLAVLDAGTNQGLAPDQVLHVYHAGDRYAGPVRVGQSVLGDQCVVLTRPGTVAAGDYVFPAGATQSGGRLALKDR